MYFDTLQECYTVTGRHIKICRKKFNDENILILVLVHIPSALVSAWASV